MNDNRVDKQYNLNVDKEIGKVFRKGVGIMFAWLFAWLVVIVLILLAVKLMFF